MCLVQRMQGHNRRLQSTDNPHPDVDNPHPDADNRVLCSGKDDPCANIDCNSVTRDLTRVHGVLLLGEMLRVMLDLLPLSQKDRVLADVRGKIGDTLQVATHE
jgi:hypothetical protein